MRQFNERIVLQAIRLQGPTPKAELARLTQLSKQTVSIIVERLLDDGLLLKCDRLRGGIGQPSVPLALNPDGACSVGVQVGRRSLELLVANFLGQAIHHETLHYDLPDPDVVLPEVRARLEQARARLGDRWNRVVGIGLAAPLAMHQWTELLGPTTGQALARWESIDLQAQVQAMTELPVVFARDTVAACTAELLQGQGTQRRDFLYIFVGTFVGGGLVLAGHVVSGPQGNAGAIGSMPLGLATHSKGAGGAAGLAGAPAQLLERASVWTLERALRGAGLDPHLTHTEGIMAPALSPLVTPWLEEAASALAMVATSAAALLDLDCVIVDGSIAPPLLAELTRRIATSLGHYRQAGIRPPELLRGQVGAHARALGGALLPLHTQFFPDKSIFLKQDPA
jgi:predicted NBD/HSP70 family sugar kinase